MEADIAPCFGLPNDGPTTVAGGLRCVIPLDDVLILRRDLGCVTRRSLLRARAAQLGVLLFVRVVDSPKAPI